MLEICTQSEGPKVLGDQGVLIGVTPPGLFIWKILFCCTVILSGPTQASDWLIPEPPRLSFQLVVTVYVPAWRFLTIQSKLCAETVLSLKLRKHPPLIAMHWVESTWKRLVLI